MSKLKEYSDTFETLSKSIVKYLLRDVDTEIVQTKSKKDGGYDIIVKCQDGNTRKCALFECKLRKANLNDLVTLASAFRKVMLSGAVLDEGEPGLTNAWSRLIYAVPV